MHADVSTSVDNTDKCSNHRKMQRGTQGTALHGGKNESSQIS